MSTSKSSAARVFNPQYDLVLERVVDVPRELVWRAWTEPEHMKHWFVPKPWSMGDITLDLRAGGAISFDMISPDGERHPNVGCYLEVIPNERLTWTDALLDGYRPSGKPFMTATIELASVAGGTKYTATAIHADEETRARHEAMGFHDGWGTVLTQLVEYIKNTTF